MQQQMKNEKLKVDLIMNISHDLKTPLTSMIGSRIYVRTYLESGNAVFCIQNTSAYEIDFSPEEIIGRFVRGDESRCDGGNGLGLAIAKTYSEVCDGEFKIDIDGDMFKVTIQFPMVVNNILND